MKNKAYILRCVALIEEKVNWGDNADWVDYNFKQLSDRIFGLSKVSISVRTLKRIFRQTPDSIIFYEPQMATKNALAIFLDYADWADFILSNFSEGKKTANEPMAKHKLPVKIINYKLWASLAFLVALIIAGLTFSRFQKNTIEFTTKKVSGDNVAFSYDLKDIKYNTAAVDLDYGRTRTLINRKNEFTYPFKLPDHYRVKLLADGAVLGTKNILIASDGWVSVVQQGLKEILITDKHVFYRANNLYFDTTEVKKIKIDPHDEYWVDYRNIRDFDIEGDNLIIEMDVQNSKKSGGIDCFDTSIEYLGEYGNGRVKFVRPGCAQFAAFDFGELHYNGNFHNLNSLGLDLSEWSKVRIEVINKVVSVFINNRLAYTNSYHEPIGKVKGIKCKFKGSGSIDNFKLYNLKKELVYAADFNNPL